MAKTVTCRVARWGVAWAVLSSLSISLAGAAVPKEPSVSLDHKEFFLPELYISSANAPLADVIGQLPNRAAWEAFTAQRADEGSTFHVFIDPRSGAATNIMGAVPLIPGNGVGNDVSLELLGRRLGRTVKSVDATAVAEATLAHIRANAALLGIDPSQLGAVKATPITSELWQVSIPQQYLGVPVRHGRLAATISHGNLVTMGVETWGNVAWPGVKPSLSSERALEAGFAFVEGRTGDDEMVSGPSLEIIPFAPPQHQSGERFEGPIGRGYGHRLVWTFVFQRPTEGGQWEVMVDAHSGQVIAFQDANHYVERHITGGVYPLTNTEVCPNAQKCGSMRGYPMPFADTGFPAPNNFANSAGVYDYPGGFVTTRLAGRYVSVRDSCVPPGGGGTSESSSNGVLDLGGVNGQHDCTSAGTSGGDTAASRTGFYEVNKMAEMARGYLPANTWLQANLTSNVNMPFTCNAFWNGATINFYTSGDGCRNTGELGGVIDHEWGHGLDDNDANGSMSNSSEGYADIAALYRNQDSCVGHGFFETIDLGCGQSADGKGFNIDEDQTTGLHCATDCSGVRDADWGKHSDNTPDTALGHVCNRCAAAPSNPGPCGRQVHCAAAPQRQAAWDLVARDLVGAPFNLDSQSAFIVGNKLFYQGSGNIGTWYACTCGQLSSGCGTTNGYIQWIAADDDNGNLNDGTPHMTAIFNAFDRHGIACAAPAPANSGCSGGPQTAPTLTATPGIFQVALSWNSVPGATRFWVFRTEGHAGCNYGKTLIAEVTGLSYTDTQVATGRPYYYNVVAAGASSACYSRASNCVLATPRGDWSISCSPNSLTVPPAGSGTSTCTVTSSGGFSSTVNLGCSGPSGTACSMSPTSVTLDPGGSAVSTLAFSLGFFSSGTLTFRASGTPPPVPFGNHIAEVNVTVASPGSAIATFDPALQAPNCGATVGRSCDTGPSLVKGRAGRGPEPNQPNTIYDSCADGGSIAFPVDGSNDRIKVATLDGTNFANGKGVQIDATVRPRNDYASDAADFFYAADATLPSWVLIGTVVPTGSGAQVLSARYRLPAGGLQAVRVQFRRLGTSVACAAGSVNDRDDLIFAVDNSVFSDTFETALGWTTNPSGTDTATAGQWERGQPEETNFHGVKQLGTTTSGVNDLVTGRLAGAAPGDHDVDGARPVSCRRSSSCRTWAA